MVTAEHAELFINGSQLDEAAREYLSNIVNIHPYDAFFEYLGKLPGQTEGSVRMEPVVIFPSVNFYSTEDPDWR